MKLQCTDVPLFLLNVCLVQALQRDGIFTQQDQTTAEQRKVIGSRLRLESNILSNLVANGEGAAPVTPVEFQQEVVSHLPLSLQ